MTSWFDPDLWRVLAQDPAPRGLVRRRILPTSSHDAFIGELRPGRERVLLLEIKGSSATLPRRRPSSKGLIVDVDDSEAGKVKIRLKATSAAAAPLFAELADDVVGVLAAAPNDDAAALVLDRIVAWQLFFATKRDDFTAERAAALFAELHVLQAVFLPFLGHARAIDSWHGPDPAVQDFQVADLAVEVKSFRGTGAGHLMISSEQQLELTGVNRLYVAYVRLDQRPDGTGLTISDVINALRSEIAESGLATHLLEMRLLSAGWHDSYSDQRPETYAVRSMELFGVVDDFPRIISAGLPNGVGSVSYSIDRGAIEEFLIPWGDFSRILMELLWLNPLRTSCATSSRKLRLLRRWRAGNRDSRMLSPSTCSAYSSRQEKSMTGS